ncbi:MAG: hypothetical protein IM658_03600 [Phenylobacterium sp.]|uniref:hypothetical protein n=1 Tax=Phenylobacterium sp. TaxID=1871053 RepID=UPI0025E771C1|nr:hypothetical protein [Phenylobacterium sp.]MCA3711917.1 hypothetical protein [Phenylobacterium sp.]MCA3729597.1 hypothetical protein [Phenylobacterium sp.]MCA3745420.1 hypothetical protein [Phenylobacterium sp.]MCA3751151.1 hypothetical protein [Phenylobacterium sp.]MCA4916469.1 hypothetical protein [Phenylobacterium sp.]
MDLNEGHAPTLKDLHDRLEDSVIQDSKEGVAATREREGPTLTREASSQPPLFSRE